MVSHGRDEHVFIASALKQLCGTLMGRTFKTLCWVVSTISTLLPSRMGTATNRPSGVDAHWLGLPVSGIVSTTLSVAVSMTLRLRSDSMVTSAPTTRGAHLALMLI